MLDDSLFYYPDGRLSTWTYCLPLGKYTHPVTKKKYDLGVYVAGDNVEVSAAIVYGNEPGEYLSGDLYTFSSGNSDEHSPYLETLRRYHIFKEMVDIKPLFE
jgi:hypothetical protein